MGGQAFVEHEASEAARTIATVFHFAAVVVVDAVVEVDIGLARRLDEQHLVEADAEVAVGHLPDLCGAELDRVRDKIEHHEVVAEAVHFGER